MSYAPEVFEKIKVQYETRRREAIDGQLSRMEEVNRTIPGIAELNEELGSTGLRIMTAIREGKDLSHVRLKNEELLEKRKKLLKAYGYAENYIDPKYCCEKCLDTGYAEGKPCVCMKQALYEAQAALSGLGELLGKQTFENFSIQYYKDREKAEKILEYSKKYAGHCLEAPSFLLLMGGTGLGKTHLSTAIADSVMKNGGSVLYESAQNVLADFQYERFSRGFQDTTPVKTDKYFEADLLIIDDLGSEMQNQFTVSTVYNLINTRLCRGKSMLCSTNLSPKELAASYDQRITSRIFGEFTLLKLEGQDVRMQKLKEKQG